MRQALHIFKKDVRYLRWELAVSLGFLALYVYLQVHHGMFGSDYSGTIGRLLLAFWSFLCARLVHSEAIPGDRQFWVTRPYKWQSLLGAKVLFVVGFVCVPLLGADAVILVRDGFSLATNAAGLLWSLTLMTGSALLLFCAFATLTRGLVEWMLSAVVTVGVIYGVGATGPGNMWGGVEWIREGIDAAILFAAAVVVLLGQYKRRRTVLFAVVLAVAWVGSELYTQYANPVFALDLETRFSKAKADPSSIQIAVHARNPEPRRQAWGAEIAALSIPLEISGLGEGQDVISDDVQVVIADESGELWRRDGHLPDQHLEHSINGYPLIMRVSEGVMARAKGHPVELRLTLYLTLLGNPVSKVVQPGGRASNIGGVGRCWDIASVKDSWILCDSAMRAPSKFLVVSYGGERRDRFSVDVSYSPFPADLSSSIRPLGRFFHSGSRTREAATLTSLEPLAHFRRELTIRQVNLADYQF